MYFFSKSSIGGLTSNKLGWSSGHMVAFRKAVLMSMVPASHWNFDAATIRRRSAEASAPELNVFSPSLTCSKFPQMTHRILLRPPLFPGFFVQTNFDGRNSTGMPLFSASFKSSSNLSPLTSSKASFSSNSDVTSASTAGSQSFQFFETSRREMIFVWRTSSSSPSS